MLEDFPSSANILRQRSSRSQAYKKLSTVNTEKNSSFTNSTMAAPSCQDSVRYSEENHSPVLLNDAVQELIAFGMICPKVPKSQLNEDLSMAWVLSAAGVHGQGSTGCFDKDNGFYHCEKRLIGMSAVRDDVGVSFRIYELPETREELKVFSERDYDKTVRKIRSCMQALHPNHDVIDFEGNSNTDQFTVVEVYDDKLKRIKEEARGRREQRILELLTTERRPSLEVGIDETD